MKGTESLPNNHTTTQETSEGEKRGKRKKGKKKKGITAIYSIKQEIKFLTWNQSTTKPPNQINRQAKIQTFLYLILSVMDNNSNNKKKKRINRVEEAKLSTATTWGIKKSTSDL